MAKFYVLCDDDCRYEGMTKEEILAAIEQALEQGYVSDPDGAVFSKIKELRAGDAVQIWLGTEAEFNAISPAPKYGTSLVRVGADGVLYVCSDASLNFDNVYTKAESDEKYANSDNVYTKAESDEKYANSDNVYTKAESDEKYGVVSEVTVNGTKPVSGAAVVAYIDNRMAQYVDFEEVAF